MHKVSAMNSLKENPGANGPLPSSALEKFKPIFDPSQTSTWALLEEARKTRETYFGNQVFLCNILNAKSGLCTEDCAFCSQSLHAHASPPIYPFMSRKDILAKAREAASFGARCFSLVTSGRALDNKKDRQQLLLAIEEISSQTDLETAASLGLASPSFLKELKSAGLTTYHHNLETAPSHYNKICRTHSFERRLQTVRAVKDTGLKLCCGGILGLGESLSQRAELALSLKALKPDRIPINFLNPIAGTAMEKAQRLRPLEALHIVAALRVILPEQEITICGGREVVLQSLQPLLFVAGANGIMTGNYLTTPGQGVEKDLQMISDLGLNVQTRGKGQ